MSIMLHKLNINLSTKEGGGKNPHSPSNATLLMDARYLIEANKSEMACKTFLCPFFLSNF